MKIDDLKLAAVFDMRFKAVEFQAMVRAMKFENSIRAHASVSLYPVSEWRDHFRVTVKIRRIGLLDGIKEFKTIKDYLQSKKNGNIWIGNQEFPYL